MRNKSRAMENTAMGAGYVEQAKSMAGMMLNREHRGPGDTIEAAAYRLQTKYGVPQTLLMRLRHREVNDMLMSSFIALAQAYQAATERMERNIEHEKTMATNATVLRLVSLILGSENEPKTPE